MKGLQTPLWLRYCPHANQNNTSLQKKVDEIRHVGDLGFPEGTPP